MATFQRTVESYRQGALTMPRERYTSPEILLQEQERIFARSCNCARSQLGILSRRYRPGAYSPRESIPAAWDAEYLRMMG